MHNRQLPAQFYFTCSKFVHSVRRTLAHLVTIGENFLQTLLTVDFWKKSRNICQIEFFCNFDDLATF